jgi:hypothetical protein
MNLKWFIEYFPFLLIGIYLIIKGLTSSSLISESDVPATPEERARAKPTPLGRMLLVITGLLSIVYVVIHSTH